MFVEPKPIIANNDWFLKELYAFTEDMGITSLSANYSRYVIDLNRILTDPIIGDDYNKYTIYSKTTWKKDLYKKMPNESECKKRIGKYYIPYHNKLKELVNNKLRKFGYAIILDLHSGYSSTGEKDICLGDGKGTTSNKEIVTELKKSLEDSGYTINLNTPCTGGKILRQYHKENPQINCILFELNYKKYIKDQYSGEEEIKEYDINLFNDAQKRLKKAMNNFLFKYEKI